MEDFCLNAVGKHQIRNGWNHICAERVAELVKALDPRSMGLEFDSRSTGHV